MSWLFGPSTSTTQFDELVDKATSELSPPDNDETLLVSLQLSDLIRSKSIEAPLALKSIRRRLALKNFNVQLQSIHVLDVLVKNSGEAFLLAIANGKDGWMTQVEELCRSSNHDVRQAALKNVQNWALAFQSDRSRPALSSSDLVSLYNRLRYSLEFPKADQALTSSMITSMSAPEWVDSDICQRCRTPFSLTNRKHHCRNCGGVFCGECSSKKMKLEHLGIEQEVRVCDGCHKQLSSSGPKTAGRPPGSPPKTHRPTFSASSNGISKRKTQEEIDFEKAIALSLAESQSSSAPPAAYESQRSLPGVGYGYDARPSQPPTSQPKQEDRAALMPSKQLEEEDPDLAAAIRASLADVPAQPQASSAYAPNAPSRPSYSYEPQTAAVPSVPSYELTMTEFDALDSFANVLSNGRTNVEDANELFYKADRHRAKMVRALEDASVKTELLAETNGKLQQAVRLYDSLLDRGINRYQHSYAQPYQQHQQPMQQQPYYYHQQQPQAAPYDQHMPPSQQPYPNAQPSSPTHHQPTYSNMPPNAQMNRQSSTSYQSHPQTQQRQASYTYNEPTSSHPPQHHDQAHYAPQGSMEQPSMPPEDSHYYHAQPTSSNQPQGYETYGAPQDPAMHPVPPQQNYEQALSPNGSHAPLPEQAYAPAPSAPAQHEPHATYNEQPAPAPVDHEGHKLRVQGYYSAASFPSVPELPVGGLPAAPNGHISDKKHEQVEKAKVEEALIDF